MKVELKKFNYKKNLKHLADLWQRIHVALFFLLLFVAIAWGILIWKTSLNGSGWDQNKKNAFLQSLNSGARLKENDYQKALSDFQVRKNYQSEQQNIKNIFEGY